MPRRNDFYGPTQVRNDEIIVAGFDTETDGLGGRLLSVQWGIFGEVTVDTSENMVANFFDTLLKFPSPVIWYGHFAQYDWRYFLDYIVEEGLDVEIAMRTATDIYEIRIKNAKGQRVIMRDSYALWNSKLEKLAQSFCPEIPKLEIDFEKVRFDPTNPQHLEYAKRDVQILLVGIPRLCAMLQRHFNVLPSGTFAGTAVKSWQAHMPADRKYNSSKWGPIEAYIRQAYYGGLVFLTTTNVQENCTTIDLNSSYPASMCDFGVPYGRTTESVDYHDDRMGIYHVVVRAPDDLRIPILPARDAKGNMRWFRGEFETVVTNRELVFAAKHGYEILEIKSGLVWEETIFPFNDFIEKCKAIRKEFALPADAPKGTPITAEETLAKFMQNSLYGKFGSRRKRRKMFAAHAMTDEQRLTAVPYDDEGKWYMAEEMDEEMRCMPEWAVFITAHSRLRLLQAAYSIGVENVFYGDTDSLTVKTGFETLADIGSEYGQWKVEKIWKQFRAIAPKVYTGIFADGRFYGAAKGLPRKGITDEHWRELLETGQTSAVALSLPSLRVAMKVGVKPATSLVRKSSTLDNSSNYLLLPSGEVSLKIAA